MNPSIKHYAEGVATLTLRPGVSYDGSNQILYLDGESIATNHPTQYAYATIYYYQFGIGYTAKWPGGNGGWYKFGGVIDEPSKVSAVASASVGFIATLPRIK